MTRTMRSYFAFKPECGCCVGVCLIMPELARFTSITVEEWTARGLRVEIDAARRHRVRVCRCEPEKAEC